MLFICDVSNIALQVLYMYNEHYVVTGVSFILNVF